MKITSMIFGSTVGILLMIAFPYLFFEANIYFDFFVIKNGFLKIFGLTLIIIGSGLFVYCSRIFKIIGKGTPVPIEPPKEVVHKGLYKHIRNPMYIAYFAIIIGEALFFGAALMFAYAGIYLLVIHFYVVYFEERNLRKRFGSSYLEFTKQVPRWIPRIG